jgi:hypothetical protein
MKKVILAICVMASVAGRAQYAPADSLLQAQLYQMQADLFNFREQRNQSVGMIAAGVGLSVLGGFLNTKRNQPSNLLYIMGGGLAVVGSVRYHTAHRYFSKYGEPKHRRR